MTLTLVSNIQ